MGPTAAGFLTFVRDGMGIPESALPDDSIWLGYAYNVALELVNLDLACVAPTVYTLAVYNLAGSNLINFAQDVPPSTFFADLRAQWNINSFVSGVVSSVSDVSTSTSLVVPDFFKDLSLADLQYLKDPYGRQYLIFAQRYGSLWGLS